MGLIMSIKTWVKVISLEIINLHKKKIEELHQIGK